MKTILRITCLALCISSSTLALSAQGGPPPWAGGGRGSAAGEGGEMAALERFLSMSDAELAALQDAIARVRAMSPDERAELRAEIAAYRQLPPAQRAEIRSGWGWHNEKDRDDWRAMMHAKTPEERAAIQSELQALPAEKRSLRKLELLEAWRASKPAPDEG